MNATRRVAAGALALTAALAVSACAGTGGGPAPSGSEGGTLGALYFDTNGFYGGIKKGIETVANDRGFRLIGNNIAGDVAAEAEFMSTLVGADVDAIIMSPASETSSLPAVRSAAEAGIPIVCYNTCLAEGDAEQYVAALVTTDNYQFGADIGDYAADYFIEAGIDAPRVGVIGCPRVESCKLRATGFIEGLTAKLPHAEIVADQEAFLQDTAIEVVTNIITANPELDAVFASNEGGTLGAVEAVDSTGRTGKTVVFGLDIVAQIADALLEGGILKAVNAQFPQEMGAKATEIALEVIAGNEPAQFLNYLPTEVYTSEDPDAVQQWLDDHADGLP